jgi:ribosomal protein S18 acetylase RimI-like enzyme
MRTPHGQTDGMRTATQPQRLQANTLQPPEKFSPAGQTHRVADAGKNGHGSRLEIRRTLPDHLRSEAAKLYYLAFEQKLGSLIGPNARGARLLEEGLDLDSGLFAFEGERLVGLVGFQLHGQRLINITPGRIVQEFGLLAAAWRLAYLMLFERKPLANQFLLDGICVAEDARGLGVGTRLLEAARELAVGEGCEQIRLDVIDRNPRARALYERFGFQAMETTQTGWLTKRFGFAASTRMIYDLHGRNSIE